MWLARLAALAIFALVAIAYALPGRGPEPVQEETSYFGPCDLDGCACASTRAPVRTDP